jgi:hypothetical protein
MDLALPPSGSAFISTFQASPETQPCFLMFAFLVKINQVGLDLSGKFFITIIYLHARLPL